MELDELSVQKNRLPINRKERFYTGTVLPGLIYSDGMHGLFDLLRETGLVLDYVPDMAAVQIFTEYDLRDAIRGDERSSWKHLLSRLEKEVCAEGATQLSGDTPDLVILVEQPKPLLIVIEAKLFNGESAKDLKIQIDRQQRYVVEPLKEILGNVDALQIALVPLSMSPDIVKLAGDPPAFRVITWQGVVAKYESVDAAAYWIGPLSHALSRFDDLLSQGSRSQGHASRRMTASEILLAHQDPDCPIRHVGAAGRTWRLLQQDIASSGGTRRTYAVNHNAKSPGRNYLPVADFISFVQAWRQCGVPGQQNSACVRQKSLPEVTWPTL